MTSDSDQSQWPVWANEKVYIEEPNPNWARMGEEEKEALRNLLRTYSVHAIEHIGSTSVPQLPAKPIIDLMIKVEDFSGIGKLIPLLAQHDWIYVPQSLDQREWRRYFVKVRDQKRVAHLHIVKAGTEKWDEHLLFRDTLRAEPDLAKQYAALKKQLSFQYSEDREAYTEAKAQFIKSILKS